MLDDFEKMVKAMRTAQKEYFRTRGMDVLRLSKQLERDVDKYIADREQKKAEPDERQMDMFGGQE